MNAAEVAAHWDRTIGLRHLHTATGDWCQQGMRLRDVESCAVCALRVLIEDRERMERIRRGEHLPDFDKS